MRVHFFPYARTLSKLELRVDAFFLVFFFCVRWLAAAAVGRWVGVYMYVCVRVRVGDVVVVAPKRFLTDSRVQFFYFGFRFGVFA